MFRMLGLGCSCRRSCLSCVYSLDTLLRPGLQWFLNHYMLGRLRICLTNHPHPKPTNGHVSEKDPRTPRYFFGARGDRGEWISLSSSTTAICTVCFAITSSVGLSSHPLLDLLTAIDSTAARCRVAVDTSINNNQKLISGDLKPKAYP